MFNLTRPVDFTDYTLLIPAIGVGNVGQLAVDLIIATLKPERVATAWHTASMPIFGPKAYHFEEESKTVSLELYVLEEKKLAVFQLRSPLIPTLVDQFHQDLLDFLQKHGFIEVLILTSGHAFEKHSPESDPFEYITNDLFKAKHKECLEKQIWTEFQKQVIYGGGNGRKLLLACTDKGFPAFLLFKYVSEGDNSQDASQMVGQLNRIFKMFESDENGQVKLTTPLSWKHLYGNEPTELIF